MTFKILLAFFAHFRRRHVEAAANNFRRFIIKIRKAFDTAVYGKSFKTFSLVITEILTEQNEKKHILGMEYMQF